MRWVFSVDSWYVNLYSNCNSILITEWNLLISYLQLVKFRRMINKVLANICLSACTKIRKYWHTIRVSCTSGTSSNLFVLWYIKSHNSQQNWHSEIFNNEFLQFWIKTFFDSVLRRIHYCRIPIYSGMLDNFELCLIFRKSYS